MEQRVEALEESHKLIVGKLDGIADAIKHLRYENEKRFGAVEGRIARIETRLDTGATKADLTAIETKMATIDGVVRSLPGTAAMITLVLSAVGLSLGGAAGLAFTLFKIFGKP